MINNNKKKNDNDNNNNNSNNNNNNNNNNNDNNNKYIKDSFDKEPITVAQNYPPIIQNNRTVSSIQQTEIR